MLGKRVGMLAVVEVLENSRVRCVCDCGNERTLKVGHFNYGKSKSCGCHWRLPVGHEKERISYGNMMARCHNPKNKRYADYGGSGIFVCDAWRSNAKQFIKDMGKCPDGFQIDRIDNTKGYSKDNCRWISPKENMANRSISLVFVVNGDRFRSSKDAAVSSGVCTATIFAWCKGRLANGVFYPPRPGCGVEPVYGE